MHIGQVTEVVPDDQLLSKALEIAKSIASKKEHAIRLTREMLYKFIDTDLREELRQEPEYLIWLRNWLQKAKNSEARGREAV